MRKQEISVTEAARRLKVAMSYLYTLIWGGQLKARKVNGRWLVSEQAVESRREARGK
jgi:excisionase family DNA binding protein